MRSIDKAFRLLSLSLLAASPSEACRINRPPAARIAEGGFSAVVVGRVTQERYTAEETNDYRPWEGTVRVQTIIKGDIEQQIFPIYRSGSSVSCDDGQPVPAEEEAWVLYLSGQDPKLHVLHSFPLTVACFADATLPVTACKGLSRSGREE